MDTDYLVAVGALCIGDWFEHRGRRFLAVPHDVHQIVIPTLRYTEAGVVEAVVHFDRRTPVLPLGNDIHEVFAPRSNR